MKSWVFLLSILFVFSLAFAAPVPVWSQACSDGIDNDLDGLIDFPADPDCASAIDETEVDPWLQSSYETPGEGRGIAISGSHAFVAYVDFGLAVFDISTPADPVLVGQYKGISGDDIEISGDDAYMISKSASKLYVFDISTPTSPVLVGTYDVADIYNPDKVVVDGNLVYIGAYQFQNLVIVDVSDPTNPVFEGKLIDSTVSCGGMFVDGSYAYCAYGYRINVIDISDTTAPSLLRTITPDGSMYGLTSDGSHLYVTGCYLMDIYDLSDPANPVFEGGMDTGSECARNVLVDSGLAYVANHGDGLRILDVSDPTAPTATGFVDPGGYVSDAAKSGDFVFVADTTLGLQVIDVSTPATPSVAGGLDGDTEFVDIFKSGSLVYAADYNESIRIIDVSDRSKPTLKGSLDTGTRVEGLWIEGQHAFLAASYSGLMVLDVSDPSNPSLAGSIATPDRALDVEVVGTLAYVLSGKDSDARLDIYDVSDPTTPSLEGSLLFSSDLGAGRLLVSGNLVYCNLAYSDGKQPAYLDNGAYLGIVDVTDPAAPILVTEFCYETVDESEAEGLDLAGDRIYAIDNNLLAIIDVSVPATPVVLGTFADEEIQDVKVEGNIAYIAGHWAAPLFRVLNVLDPSAPYSAGLLDIDVTGLGLVVDDGFAYIAAREKELQIVGFTSFLFADGFEDGTTDLWTSTGS